MEKSIRRARLNGRTAASGGFSRMRSTKVICLWERPILLTLFPRGDSTIVGNPISIIRGTTTNPLFRKKYGTRHKRFGKAGIIPTRMYPMRQEPNLQESMHSAVCASAAFAVRILRGVPIIRIPSIKSRYGNAGQQLIRELKTVPTVRRLIRLSLRMLS